MPGKPFQSKLEPFLELIRQWRRQRWSYPRIAETLRTDHGMTVAPSTIFSFVKVRAKGQKVFALPSSDALPANRRPSPASPTSEAQHRANEFFTPTSDSIHETTRKYNIG
jgi:IS30 family transposase